MAISNFIPTIWSESLLNQLGAKYIAVKHCNRQFEGEIKHVGSSVRVCGIGPITISDYSKNTDMSAPETLTDTASTLTVDRAKYFNFQIDDIDRAQAKPILMDGAMKVAADGLAAEADKYVFSLYTEADSEIVVDEPDADTIINDFIEARRILYTKGVTDTDDVVIEVTPDVAALLIKAKINLSTDNTEALENGCIGKIAGCRVFVSNNIAVVDDEEECVLSHKCLVRSKSAVAYAERISEVCAYRPEKRFADAVKGLHLYGAKVMYPEQMVVVGCNFAYEPAAEDEEDDEEDGE